MNKLFILLSILTTISCAQKNVKENEPYIPLNVYKVDVHRVKEEIIKVIISYVDGIPEVILERVSTPDLKLLETYKINEIKLNTGEKLDLENMSSLDVNKITISENIVNIPFEYFPLTGPGILADCKITIKEDYFSGTNCTPKPINFN